MPPVSDIPRHHLGSTGWEVGAVGLGCMGMSGAYGPGDGDDHRSTRVIRRAIDLGVNLIDTADVYGPYHNERLVGTAIAGRRDDVRVATKVGLVFEDAATFRVANDGRPEHVRAGIDGSLRRLGVDVVDLYQLHRVDPAVPIEETWGAMADLVDEGKVRALGLSETGVSELDRAHAVHPVASVQSELSLWTRERLDDVVPWCARNGAAFIAFAPLGRAFLTGTLPSALDPRDWRARNP